MYVAAACGCCRKYGHLEANQSMFALLGHLQSKRSIAVAQPRRDDRTNSKKIPLLLFSVLIGISCDELAMKDVNTKVCARKRK